MAVTTATTTPQAQDQMQQAAAPGGGGWDAAAAPAPQSQPATPQPPDASQPSQSPDQTAPQSPTGNTLSATPPPAAPATVQPVVVTSQRPQGLAGVVDSIADALAGKTKPEIGTDAQGNQYVKQQNLSRGEQWVRIGATLAEGAAKGMQAGKGRNPGAAAAAGFDSAQKQAKDAAAETPALQKQILANANYQKLRMDAAEQSWHLSQLKHEATQHDIAFSQGQEDRLMKVDGATLLGTAADPNDIDKILHADPEVMKSMIQNHQIEILPHYNADGTAAGIRVFKMPDGYRKTIEPSGTVFHTFDSKTGQYIEHKSSEPLTAGEVDDYETAASNAAQKFKLDQANIEQKTQQAREAKANADAKPLIAASEVKKNDATASESGSVIAKNYSEADRNKAQAKQLNEASDATVISSNAQQMVDGQIDPSNLSRRSKSYDATIAQANAYSLAKYGKPFDPAKAMGDYKFATNTQTYNTLNYLNSLTGRDDKSGNLATLVQQSNAMPRASSFPPINDKAQWAKLASGNRQVAAYYATVTEVADQVAKILQGGGTGSGTSDAKLRQAQDLFDKGFTANQVEGVANDSLRPLLANRKKEIIGDNRYLQQWHQPQAAAPPQGPGATAPIAAPAGAPTGATQVWHDPQGKVLGYTVNGKYQAGQ